MAFIYIDKEKETSMGKCPFHDAFAEARTKDGFVEINDQDDPVKMILRHRDVRKTAHNWKTFQSGAKPGRIVIPSEVAIRDTRQIPFEVDPPDHTEYRSLVEGWFRRPLEADYELKLKQQIDSLVDEMLNEESFEVVSDFALKVQSSALTLLLNIPYEESEKFISWGTHVFRSDDNPLDKNKAKLLYDYIDQQIDNAIESPGENLYSVLLNSEFQGKKLTKEEVKGTMILTFAGGRDTIISAVTNTIAYLGDHPESLARLKAEPEIIPISVEELIRYFSPLTQMGRVVTEDTIINEEEVKKDTRVSLCWASANRDASVFENPDTVILNRKMNPHVGFGFSHQKCLGAHHARQILKTLISALCNQVKSIDIHDFEENLEELGTIKRKVGYHKLRVTLNSY